LQGWPLEVAWSNRLGDFMDTVGIDIAKAKFDAALLVGERPRQAAFANTEAGFQQFLAWLVRHRPDPSMPLHACMEATGNWGWTLPMPCMQPVRASVSSIRRASRPTARASSPATRPTGSTRP
jgi:hypothetical protein